MTSYLGALIFFWCAGVVVLCGGFLRTYLRNCNPRRAALESASGAVAFALAVRGEDWSNPGLVFGFGLGIPALAVLEFMMKNIVPKRLPTSQKPTSVPGQEIFSEEDF